MPLFTSGGLGLAWSCYFGLGLGIKNFVLFTSLEIIIFTGWRGSRLVLAKISRYSSGYRQSSSRDRLTVKMRQRIWTKMRSRTQFKSPRVDESILRFSRSRYRPFWCHWEQRFGGSRTEVGTFENHVRVTENVRVCQKRSPGGAGGSAPNTPSVLYRQPQENTARFSKLQIQLTAFRKNNMLAW